MQDDILLSRAMNLLKNLTIDINENIGGSHIPHQMQMRINEATNLVDDYYFQQLKDKQLNDKLFSKIKELSQNAIP